MEAEFSSETSVNIYLPTKRHIHEDLTFLSASLQEFKVTEERKDEFLTS